MKISPHRHQQIRIKNLAVTVILLCVIAALAWFSSRYSAHYDISGNSANTLSPPSVELLKSLPDPINITAYIKKGQPIRSQISQLVARYRLHKGNFNLNFIDPESEPEKTRELNIGPSGLILVNYRGREEKINFLDESTLTNALLQLANAKERWVSFLTGHGERSPDGSANFDLGQFGKALARRKINSQSINLAAMPAIPDNSALLVISAPSVALLPGEIDIIRQYIGKGGNLLLLGEPDNSNLAALSLVGLKALAGTIVENNVKLYGINDASFVVASEYAKHPITQGFQTITLYPAATALELDDESNFQAESLFDSSSQSWTETGALKGEIRFDADSSEKQGPLHLAFALTRELDNKTQQRIIAVGDGDFLSNTYIGNVGNQELGLRLINWLIHDDHFIHIPAKNPIDNNLQLTKTTVAILGFGFLVALPLLLLSAGFLIWRKRKQR